MFASLVMAIYGVENATAAIRDTRDNLILYKCIIHSFMSRDAVVVCKHCSPLVEFMIIKCQPFYLPR